MGHPRCRYITRGSDCVPKLSYLVIRKSLYKESPFAAWLFGAGYAAKGYHQQHDNINCNLAHLSHDSWVELSGLSSGAVTDNLKLLREKKEVNLAARASCRYNHACSYRFKKFSKKDILVIVDPAVANYLRSKYKRAWLSLTVLLFKMWEYSNMDGGVCKVGSNHLSEDLYTNDALIRRLAGILVDERLIEYTGNNQEHGRFEASEYKIPCIVSRITSTGKETRKFVAPKEDKNVKIAKRPKPNMKPTTIKDVKEMQEDLKAIKRGVDYVVEEIKAIREGRVPYHVLPDKILLSEDGLVAPNDEV